MSDEPNKPKANQPVDPKVTVEPQTSTQPSAQKRRYTLVLVDDFRSSGRLTPRTSIDKDTFAGAMHAVTPRVAVSIKLPFANDTLSEFELSFESVRAFEADSVLRQAPPGRTRLLLREKLMQRRKGALSADELNAALESVVEGDTTLRWLNSVLGGASAEAPPSAADAQPSILDMVDEPTADDKVRADVERAAAGAGDAAKRVSAGEGKALDTAIAKLDDELNQIADALYKHPDVRAIEAAWRGLKFLVNRIDFREGVRLMLVDADAETFVDHAIADVIDPAFDGEMDTPGMILLGVACANNPESVARFDTLAQHAAGLPVPVVFPIEAAFFNVRQIGLVKNLPNLSGLLDGWEFAKWRSLREQPYARALAPVVGRFLLRGKARGEDKPSGYRYEQHVTGPSALLWGGGHLAMGVCAARAFAKHGWPTRMYGAEAGRIEDLPIVENPADTQKNWGPGDAQLPERKTGELTDIGMNVLHTVRDRDYCLLLGGVSAAKTADGENAQAARLEASLPYQQFNNITAAWLCEQGPALQGLTVEQIQEQLIIGLRNLMRLGQDAAQDAIMVGVDDDPQQSDRWIVRLHVTPPGTIAPGALQVQFAIPVRK